MYVMLPHCTSHYNAVTTPNQHNTTNIHKHSRSLDKPGAALDAAPQSITIIVQQLLTWSNILQYKYPSQPQEQRSRMHANRAHPDCAQQDDIHSFAGSCSLHA